MKTGHLEYCNAGHNAPLIFTDKIDMVPVMANLPLGIMPEFDFQQQSIDLHHDDALFLYTDGVTEAERADHEQYGEQRLLAFASAHAKEAPASFVESMNRDLDAFTAGAEQSDDITMLGLCYREDVSAS